MVYEWFDLKTTRTIFTGLASKPVVMVSNSLSSKPAATIFGSLASKTNVVVFSSLTSKLVRDSFSRFGLKIGGGFLG
jgi:hypothetical protein